jgi:hypothetical protein
MRPGIHLWLACALTMTIGSCAHAHREDSPLDLEAEEAMYHGDDAELSKYAFPYACKKATAAQIAEVNRGNAKKAAFLQRCATATGGSRWCDQLIRPNPESKDIFACTYGPSQVHQLIHPDESTWVNAFETVKIVDELHNKGISVCLIYNWWRPEPYNKNVGGAPGRHPFGTSVDVRFCTVALKDRAFAELCQMRKAGRINAVGYYTTKALHIGVGDKLQNTWGKTCP